ncbi:hypothetical protein [Enterococcus spodopteracolus]|uniref:hypothetical protein n=1 Tax=Enterococcus spodopteracolus TaxID=3034501 RepID=UPI00264800FD|nr:hypothetical protein [Enterococcus spodopteracolus]
MKKIMFLGLLITVFLLSGCGNNKSIDLSDIRSTTFDDTVFTPVEAEIENNELLKLEFTWKYGKNENSREKYIFNGTYVRIDVSQNGRNLKQANTPAEARMNNPIYEAQEATIRPRYELLNTKDAVEVLISDKTTGKSYRHFVIDLNNGTAEQTEINDISISSREAKRKNESSDDNADALNMFISMSDFYASLKEYLNSNELNNVIEISSDNLVWAAEQTLTKLETQAPDSAEYLKMLSNRCIDYATAARKSDEEKLDELSTQIDRIIGTLSKNYFDDYMPDSIKSLQGN